MAHECKILKKSYYDWIYTLTRYTRKLQIRKSDSNSNSGGDNDTADYPTGDFKRTVFSVFVVALTYLLF